MKKTLLASAIAASIAAPAIASAAAATLYGQAHISADYLKGYRPDKSSESGIGLSSNSSRIGVKGSFDLGGGLEAIYLMEWEVAMDGDTKDQADNAASNDLANMRNRYAGFKSDTWGTIVFGRHDTPVKVVGRKADLFWSTQLGQNRTITNSKDGGAGFDFRADNVIGYISPNFGPVHIFAAYVTDHNEAIDPNYPITDNNDFDAYSVAGFYDQNNLFTGDDNLLIAVGYEQHNVDKNVTGSAEDNENALRVTGKYSIGGFTIPVFYQKGDNLGFQNNSDRDIYGGGLAYKVGANTFKGQVYVAGENATDDGAMLYSIGIDHDLAKNVQVYAQGSVLENDKQGNFNLGGSGFGSVANGANDETNYGVSFGTRIKF